MIIETIREPEGFSAAVYGMRNPMNSWGKSDSYLDDDDNFIIGDNDKSLSVKLQNAGSEHCKHLRMIYVWADIVAPRFWWNEYDTYRFGVDKVSCSTMHKLMARPLTKDDFEHDCMNNEFLDYVIESINMSMEAWRAETNEDIKKQIWRSIIEALPQSYLQKRTVCMSYAALRNIVKQRQGHKLYEWQIFIDWAKSLPNSWMLFE